VPRVSLRSANDRNEISRQSRRASALQVDPLIELLSQTLCAAFVTPWPLLSLSRSGMSNFAPGISVKVELSASKSGFGRDLEHVLSRPDELESSPPSRIPTVSSCSRRYHRLRHGLCNGHRLDLDNGVDYGDDIGHRPDDRPRLYVRARLVDRLAGQHHPALTPRERSIRDATRLRSIADDTPDLAVARDRLRDHFARLGTEGDPGIRGCGVRKPTSGRERSEGSEGKSNAEDEGKEDPISITPTAESVPLPSQVVPTI
jgi:hypothetical protein